MLLQVVSYYLYLKQESKFPILAFFKDCYTQQKSELLHVLIMTLWGMDGHHCTGGGGGSSVGGGGDGIFCVLLFV